MVTYRATLDVPRPVVEYLAGLLAAHRRQLRTPERCSRPGPVPAGDPDPARVPGPQLRALPGPRRRRLPGHRDCTRASTCSPPAPPSCTRCWLAPSSAATGAPAPPPTATTCGPPARTSSSAAPSSSWPPPPAPRGGSCDVEPGSAGDLTAARRHLLGACSPAAAAGLPILADAGYEGAGIGVPTPVKKRPGATHQHPHPDNQAYNQLLRGVRSLGARAAAELKERWRALNHITLSPHRIGHIAQAALVLNNAWR